MVYFNTDPSVLDYFLLPSRTNAHGFYTNFLTWFANDWMKVNYCTPAQAEEIKARQYPSTDYFPRFWAREGPCAEGEAKGPGMEIWFIAFCIQVVGILALVLLAKFGTRLKAALLYASGTGVELENCSHVVVVRLPKEDVGFCF